MSRAVVSGLVACFGAVCLAYMVHLGNWWGAGAYAVVLGCQLWAWRKQ